MNRPTDESRIVQRYVVAAPLRNEKLSPPGQGGLRGMVISMLYLARGSAVT